jgi:hypothetical protein
MLFKKPLQTFANFFKKKSQPVQPVRGGAQAAAQTQKPQLGPNELDPDELDDLWQANHQANHMGITPKQRAAANANNPIISDERLKAAQDIWNSPQSED